MAMRRDLCGSSVVIHRKSGNGSTKVGSVDLSFSSPDKSVGSVMDDSEGAYELCEGSESEWVEDEAAETFRWDRGDTVELAIVGDGGAGKKIGCQSDPLLTSSRGWFTCRRGSSRNEGDQDEIDGREMSMWKCGVRGESLDAF